MGWRGVGGEETRERDYSDKEIDEKLAALY
jgi:hypothetical protein